MRVSALLACMEIAAVMGAAGTVSQCGAQTPVTASQGPTERARAFEAAVDTLRRERALRDSLWEVSESLLRGVESAGDDGARLALLHARVRLLVGAPNEEAVIEEGLHLSRARRDPLYEMKFLMRLGSLRQAQGRLAEVEPILPALLSLSEANPGTVESADADYFVARRWIHSGRAAQVEPVAERAHATYERLNLRAGVAQCESLLGLVGLLTGDLSSGRPHFERAIALAQGIGRDDLAVGYLGNLGTLERYAGRLDRTLASYQEMRKIANRLGIPRQRAFAMQSTSYILSLMGRYAEAAAEAESLLAVAGEMGSLDLRARGHVALGFAEYGLGGVDAAAAQARAVVAMGDSIDLNQRFDAVLNLSYYMAMLDSLDAALGLARSIAPIAREQGGFYRVRVANAESQALRRMGRLSEAIAALEGVRKDLGPGATAGYATPVLGDLGGLYARAGMTDRARDCIRAARESYLRNREQLGDDEWKERIAGEAAAIIAAELRVGLGGGAPSDADLDSVFNRIEPLRARTLAERVAGRQGTEARLDHFVTAAELRSALDPGEVYLQWTVTEDTSVVWTITTDAVRVYPLGIAADSLGWQARELRRLLGRRPEPGDAVRTPALEAAALSLGHRLFDAMAPQLEGARRLLVSADGPMYQVPVVFVLQQALYHGSLREMPEIASVPSATLLWAGRQGRPAGPGGLLATSGHASGPDGPLPGGREEVQWLARTFERVTTHFAEDESSDSLRLGGFGGLHFAAHAESNDLSPWRSGIRLGDEDDPEDGYVRASRIATMRIPARLAVLSACETAWGAILSGEGLIGMSTAFLSAGVPTVVATQWKIDDRATIDIMKVFYRELSRGATAAAALRSAQTRVARGRYRDPYYWAGFVLVGEPRTTFEIHRRGMSPEARMSLLIVLLVAAAGLLVAARRWRRA